MQHPLQGVPNTFYLESGRNLVADALTTITGNLAFDPELRFTASGRSVANFTVAQNRRKRNPVTAEWEDDAPLFLRCTVWGDQAGNLADSLSKGDRVVVTGRLTPRSFEVDGQTRHVIELTADEVGPSLLFASARVKRTTNGAAPAITPLEASAPA